MAYIGRTDLAMEARELAGGPELAGVTQEERELSGFRVTDVRISDDRAAEILCKPIGRYMTLELGPLLRREDGSFGAGAVTLAGILREMLPVGPEETVLVAGLGNSDITPDAVGHLALRSLMVTNHLVKTMPQEFGSLRAVACVEPGVLGTTGMESGEIVKAVTERLRPAAVIAVDALASRRAERLCRTVQISDTGIIPGSGVGNGRLALNRETLGVPVIAVGVATVMDAATLAAELSASAGSELDEEELRRQGGSMIVTPRDIDARVADISKLVGYGIDLALQDGLSVADVDMFV